MQNWDGSILARKAMDCSCKKMLLKEGFLLNMLERCCCRPLFPVFVSLYITCYYVSAMIVDYMIWLMGSFDSVLNDFLSGPWHNILWIPPKILCFKRPETFLFHGSKWWRGMPFGFYILSISYFLSSSDLLFYCILHALHFLLQVLLSESCIQWRTIWSSPFIPFRPHLVYYVDFVSYSLFLIHPS
jgi:hypothetical protein